MPVTKHKGKSSSVDCMEHGGTIPVIMNQDDIIALTQNVKDFSDTLAKLKSTFLEGRDNEEVKVIAHERLGEVLLILKNVLQTYPALHSTDLFSASANLIAKIKNYDYQNCILSEDIGSFCDCIDQLALAFSSSVSEYLMGDVLLDIVSDGRTKSFDNLTTAGGEETGKECANGSVEAPLFENDVDSILVQVEAGLDLALQRAKAWSKYARDIMSYIEKKALLEIEYSRNLQKLVQSTKQNLADEGFLPLQSVYCTVLTQDMEFSSNCQTTQTLLMTSQFIEPLTARKVEHDRVRKSVKENWLKEFKKMHEAVSNLNRAQSLYMTRQQDYERARLAVNKAEGDKLEKKKKLEEEAMHKAAEAETTYKACVAETNCKHKELEKLKGEYLARVREEIEHSDQVMKKVTSEYFHLLHTVTASLPLQYQTLCETSKHYEVGSQYAEYVRRLPVSQSKAEMFVFEPFKTDYLEVNRKSSVRSNESSDVGEYSNEGSPSLSSKKDLSRTPMKAWGQNYGISDTDSTSETSHKSDESNQTSPRFTSKHRSLEELREDFFINDERKFKRTMTVGDEVLDVPGILKHQTGRRNTTFGVDFQEQVHQLNVQIPPIILKCVAEVEKRGMEVKGLYRVSGVKSTVEKLCQRFEIDPASVILDDVHPNVLSSVLKQYLRHLPEPLMTFKLYPEFIKTAKEFMEKRITNDQAVETYHYIVQKLPISNYKTSAVLMHHLQRVASHSAKNQMSAANLGIVFGPTLLKPHEGSASLATLVDTPHQTNAIEMLISSAQTIFGPAEQFQIEHSETPIENIPELQITQCDGMPGNIQDKHLEMRLEERNIQSEEDEKKYETVSTKDISKSTKPDMSVDYGLPGCTDVSSLSLKQVNTSEISTLCTQPTYGAVSLVPSISVTDRTDVNLTVTEKLPSNLKPSAFESKNVSNVVVSEISDKKDTKPKASSLPCSKRSQMVKYLPKPSKTDVPKGVSCSGSTCSRAETSTKTSPKISVNFKNMNFPIAKASIVSKINPSKSSSHVNSTESKSASGQTLASKKQGSGSETSKYSTSPSGKAKGTKVEEQVRSVKKTEVCEKSRSPQFV